MAKSGIKSGIIENLRAGQIGAGAQGAKTNSNQLAVIFNLRGDGAQQLLHPQSPLPPKKMAETVGKRIRPT
jgi:hypothetical protein